MWQKLHALMSRAPHTPPAGAGRTPRRVHRFTPRVESLQERLVPSTFTVTTPLDVLNAGPGQLSLRQAITQANQHPGADVIVLPAGVYPMQLTGAAGVNENANQSGDFDITDAVTLQGAGAALTAIDGRQLDRVFDVFGTGPSSIKVTFQGLTVRNGRANGPGGGILVGNADLLVRDCVVAGNATSGDGGGISNAQAPGTGNVTLQHSTVSRNTAGGNGGGLYFGVNAQGQGGTLTVSGSTVRRNLAGSEGGGIVADTVTLTGSTVTGNRAGSYGGGIEGDTVVLTGSTVSGNTVLTVGGEGGGVYAFTVTLTGSTVSGNFAVGPGGGLFGYTVALSRSTVRGNSTGGDGGGIWAGFTATLTGSTVSGNAAGGSGGGIYADTTATLTNSTVSGNSAGGLGGGLIAHGASLLNVTITENSAHTGGGVFGGNGTLTVHNTIIAQNFVDVTGSAPDVSGAFTSLGHNLIADPTGSTGFANGVSGDHVGTAAAPLDAMLGPLQNNGGPTQTHALLAGSPAIDKGDNNAVDPVTHQPLTTDQRGAGHPRQKDGNGDGLAMVDIGAFEL
jgi:predicted outer membrane repeat protein